LPLSKELKKKFHQIWLNGGCIALPTLPFGMRRVLKTFTGKQHNYAADPGLRT